MSSINEKKYIIKEVVIPAGGGSKHVIQENAVNFPSRSFLNFRGSGVNVLDDISNNATVIEIGSGGGGSTSVAIVADINSRDALVPSEGNLVFVEDITIPPGDPLADVGWAFYIYENGAYRLFSSQQTVTFDNTLIDTATTVEVGGINAGVEMITLRGQNHSSILTQILFPVVPFPYVQPTQTISGVNPIPGLIKAGEIITPLLTGVFTKFNAGVSISDTIKSGGTPLGPSPQSPTVSFNTPTLQLYTAETTYAAGDPIDDSHGNPTLPVIPAGIIASSSIIYEWIYPYYWGIGAKPVTGTDLTNGNEVIAKSNVALNIDFNSNNVNDFIWFAVPQGVSISPFTTWFVSALNNGNIGGVSGITTNLFPDATPIQITDFTPTITYDVYISEYETEVISTMTLS